MKDLLAIVELVIFHMIDMIEGRPVQLQDRSALETGIRHLVANAVARQKFSQLLLSELRQRELVEETLSLLSEPELRWKLAIESALTESSDGELVIFGANPLALTILAGYLLEAEHLDDASLRLWCEAGRNGEAEEQQGVSGVRDWCERTAHYLIATSGDVESDAQPSQGRDNSVAETRVLFQIEFLPYAEPVIAFRRKRRITTDRPELISPRTWRWAYALAQVLYKADAKTRKPERIDYTPYLLRRLSEEKFAAVCAVRLSDPARRQLCERRRRMCELMREHVESTSVAGLAAYIGADLEDHLIRLSASPLSGTTEPFLRAYYRINRSHKGLASRTYRSRSLSEHLDDIDAWEAGDPARMIASVHKHLITATSIHAPGSTAIFDEVANYERTIEQSHRMRQIVGSEIFAAIADTRGLYIWRGKELPVEFGDVDHYTQEILLALKNNALLLYLPSEQLLNSYAWKQGYSRLASALQLGDDYHPEDAGLFVIPCNIGLEHFDETDERATIALFAGNRVGPLHTERRYAEYDVQPYVHAYPLSVELSEAVLDKYYRQVVFELLRQSHEDEAWNVLKNASSRLEQACGRSTVLPSAMPEFRLV